VAAVVWTLGSMQVLWLVALVGLGLVMLRPGGGPQLRQILTRDLWIGLREGAEHTIPVAMACACAGIVIGIVLQTGLALRFTSFLVQLAGGHLILALLITMVAGIILGMGMPTTPAYIMQAALLIPAVIKLGVTPMAAHMFAFYFSCLSAVTPPVALAVYAAASIGGASLWGAGLQAMKFAAAGFIVPYFFVYNPALLFAGEWSEILRAVLTGTVGVVALAAGLEGYLMRPALWIERAAFLAAAFLLIDPGLVTDLVGGGLLAAAILVHRLRPGVRAPVVRAVPDAGAAASPPERLRT
jgi:TRAP-type uncharacterized transport system fused permease subunit